jgi:DNA helicase HerA-like ATPase
MGQAFADVLQLVREKGYRRAGEVVAPSDRFGLDILQDAVRSDEITSTYHSETIRALRQRLSALEGTGLFSAAGTSIPDLLSPGQVTVLMLGRLPQSYRTAVVAVLTRMLIDDRSRGAFAEKRLALDPGLSGSARDEIREIAAQSVPRTVVMLDEAQSFLAPGGATPARALFVRLVKEGRNMGLSAVLATQQPSALDQRVLSQVETFIAHQLVTEPDIRAVRENLKSEMPANIQFGSRDLDFSALLRQVPPGVCVVSAAEMNTAVRRTSVVAIRPRSTVHGGIEL